MRVKVYAEVDVSAEYLTNGIQEVNGEENILELIALQVKKVLEKSGEVGHIGVEV